jgi:hypothetical protein
MPINLSTLVNQTNSLQLAKAWVNFNGTTASPSTIRSSYNVSSVTKNGTGDYTVNFATALADANYSICLTQGGTASVISAKIKDATTPSVSNFTMNTINASFSNADASLINVQVFGN